MSSIQQIMTLIDALSHAEKLDLNVLLATSLTKSGKGKSAPVAAPAAAAAAAAEGGAVKADKPKRVISDEQKAKIKAGREAAKAIRDAAIAAGVEPPKKTKPAKPAKKAAATAAVTATAAAAESTSDGDMKKMTIDGTEYYMDPHTNNLFILESDGSLGTFTGRYQPGQEEEIDFDASE